MNFYTNLILGVVIIFGLGKIGDFYHSGTGCPKREGVVLTLTLFPLIMIITQAPLSQEDINLITYLTSLGIVPLFVGRFRKKGLNDSGYTMLYFFSLFFTPVGVAAAAYFMDLSEHNAR